MGDLANQALFTVRPHTDVNNKWLRRLSARLKRRDGERTSLTWSDDKAKRPFPLWWSQHPAAPESKRVDFCLDWL